MKAQTDPGKTVTISTLERKEDYMKEPILEFFRTTILSVVAAVIIVVLAGVNTQTGEIHINYALAFSTGLTALLTGILRGIEKQGYESNGKMKLPF